MTNIRRDFALVGEWLNSGDRVLDLGCGDGVLLHYLSQQKQTRGLGLEIDEQNIQACVQRGMSVIEQDLNKGLARFDDESFDAVVMTQALQAVNRPDKLVADMLRVGKRCIITFPNFGHWRPRLYLALKGRMPVSDYMPYSWYDTPNIHFFTVRDFEDFCQQNGYRISAKAMIAGDGTTKTGGILSRLWPNLFAETALYQLER
ncbi:methionine biosynthesis protein MetW [Umboniibacter marinipuniceus]|uniref:Methionine biosynthesis protein MetW n=1 Tax=Umboniibacter marinipuniceus TaxID=569599 RepID=A0A3M0AI16_9GAMM|nr:methionine biosynthesis protein MetW [Umboniibacter marinipuniceus]RMA82215.1 methionine biosynthesis protein MetW [Umboniibacter marinipuniceus]